MCVCVVYFHDLPSSHTMLRLCIVGGRSLGRRAAVRLSSSSTSTVSMGSAISENIVSSKEKMITIGLVTLAGLGVRVVSVYIYVRGWVGGWGGG